MGALPLVPGRDCEGCNVCCVALTINDPALRKPQGIVCHNAQPDGACSIYADRPWTCREFDCGWRVLQWVKPTMRPDRSQVLVRLRMDESDASSPVAVVFTILTEAGLAAEGLAESMAAAIMAQVAVFMEVPGQPGYTYGIGQMNEMLEDAARARDKPEMLALLRMAWEQGRAGTGRPVVLEE